METISSIDGITVKYYVEKGMGKFVFDSIISASNRILTDNDIEEFRKKAVEYSKIKGNGDRRRFKKYSEKYMDMYNILMKKRNGYCLTLEECLIRTHSTVK